MSKIKKTFAVVAATASLGLATASSAEATYTWNDAGGSTPLYGAPNEVANVYENIPNGARVQMNCWLDNAGHRWFHVTVFETGTNGYVTAGPVRDQVAVPSC